MKHNTKKGFTLVELLVVIAILAILATVSVVGYTSFIERATVSNDQNVAAQLNQFLTALKADSKGEFYEDIKANGINEDNIVEITQYILHEGGFNGKLEPQASQYGYHFYFDLDAQEYVALHDKDAVDARSPLDFLKPKAAYKDLPSLSVTNCFTKGGRYCLVETEGKWVDLLERYYEVTSLEDLQKLYDDAQAMVTDDKVTIPGFAYLIETTTFVTENGNLVVKIGTEHNTIVVQGAATVKEYVLSGMLTDLFGGIAKIDATNPLFTPTADKVITLPEDVKYVAPNFATVTNPVDAEGNLTHDVTIVISKETAEQIQQIVEVNTNVSGATVENSKGETVTFEKEVDENSTKYNVVVGEEKVQITAKNTVTGFDLAITHGTKANKVNASTQSAFIAWDGRTFNFAASNFTGAVEGETVVSEEINWSIVSVSGDDATVDYITYATISAGGVLTLKDDNGVAPSINEIVVRAEAVASDGYYEEYRLSVVRLTGVTGVKLDKYDLALDGEDKLTFINVIENNTNSKFTLSYNEEKISYNHPNSGVEVDFNIYFVNLNSEGKPNAEFEITDGKTIGLISTVDEISEYKTVKVKIDNLREEEVEIRVLSSKNLNFLVNDKKEHVKLVGDKNSILLSELFDLNGTMKVPEGAQVWFTAGFGGTDSTPGDIITDDLAWSRNGVEAIDLDADSWDTEISFVGGVDSKELADMTQVYVAIVLPNDPDDYTKGGRRISETRVIGVVNGYNINKDNYETVIANAAKTTSLVMWSDIAMVTEGEQIVINNIYGNTFKYDITKGEDNGSVHTGVINFYGTIRDVKIVGAVYPSVAFQVDVTYGTPAVVSTVDSGETSKCKIINSYIANCRSPLRVDASCTVEDTVLFGGRYSNIDIAGHATLTIKGHVVTIQQKVKSTIGGVETDVIGLGVTCWFNDVYKYVVIEEGAKFEQLNFVSKNDVSAMPDLSVGGEDIGVEELGDVKIPIMKVKDVFNQIMSDTNKYGRFHFYDVDDKGTTDTADDITTQYMNAGLIGIDKEMIVIGANLGTENRYDNLPCVRAKADTNHVCGASADSPCCSEEAKDASGCDSGHTHGSGCTLGRDNNTKRNVVTKVTISIKNYSSAVKLTITYPKDLFTCDKDTDKDGTFTMDAETTDIVFTHVSTTETSSSDYDIWSHFAVAIDGHATQLVVNNGLGIAGYDNTDYGVSVDLGFLEYIDILGVIRAAVLSVLDGKGIHSLDMTLDVRMPVASENDELFNTYLGAVEEGTYLPTADAFNENGKINFYVYKAPTQGDSNQ